MLQAVLAVVGAVVGSGFIQYLIDRRDRKKDKLGKIEKRLNVAERDARRTQLLLMMSDYPEEVGEIMAIAEHYFVELHGDWYMTSVFNNWIEKKGIARPEWFKGGRS